MRSAGSQGERGPESRGDHSQRRTRGLEERAFHSHLPRSSPTGKTSTPRCETATLRDQRPPEQRPGLPLCQASDVCIPKSYKEAVASEHRHLWSDSMQREFYGLLEAGTFAPAKMLAALACELNLDLCHFDIEQAIVRSELEEDVYMRLPQGCGALSGMIVKLGQSLYGLRQASRQWHAMLKRSLVALMISQQTFTDELVAEYGVVGAMDILGYARRTSHFGISFQRGTVEGFSLQGYADADFARKAADRGSVSGGIVTCEGGAVSWFSRTQKCVTLSTTEAEYVALGHVVKEILFLGKFGVYMLPQVGMPCIPVFEDNQGAIQLAQNPISNSNSKDIDVRHHFLWELVERGRKFR
ncbi:unnamed protein product [Ectocarpus sp. CCAP 1310/34]|nr:unnamed protein product [Ectocarpus sp. CCAP 1310/34]